MAYEVRYQRLLEDRKGKGTFRTLKQHATRLTSQAGTSDSGLIDFSSNDYLSLTHSPSYRQRFLARLQELPNSQTIFGSTGSRLLDGTTPAHTALETRLADLFESPSALLFNSGWDANVSFFSSVPQKGDWIVYDELVHASVWDGMRSGERRGVRASERVAFKHNDLGDLRRVLEGIIHKLESLESTGDKPMIFIALESLYSMDGDLAPLPCIVNLFNTLSESHGEVFSKANVWIVLDEAHTTGVYGSRGQGFLKVLQEAERVVKGKERATGSVAERELLDWVKIRVMTFGKGVGAQGAVLLSSQTIRTFLINYARPFIFSTAMGVANVVAIESAFDVLESEEGEERRTRLARISQHALDRIQGLLQEGSIPPAVLSLLPASESPFPSARGRDATAILPLITSNPHALSQHLKDRGFLVRPIVHPTVPKGKERVRICLHAGNWEGDVDALVEGIRSWAQGLQSGRAHGVVARAKL